MTWTDGWPIVAARHSTVGRVDTVADIGQDQSAPRTPTPVQEMSMYRRVVSRANVLRRAGRPLVTHREARLTTG
jgi:hypothetical protein